MKGGASLKLTMERPPKRLIAGFQDLPTTALAETADYTGLRAEQARRNGLRTAR